jgi:hypothetical protein
MDHVHIAPLSREILGDESAVAVAWLVLAAQEATVRDDLARHRLLDASLAHERQEPCFVRFQSAPRFRYAASISCVGASSGRWT